MPVDRERHFTIRQAGMEDALQIRALATELGYEVSVDEIGDRIAAVLASEAHLLLVACGDDGGVAGWIHAHVRLSIQSGIMGEISGLVVSDAAQGKGIGRALVGGAESWARGKDLTKLRVRSQTRREGAKAFYSGLGFSTAKVQRVFDKTLAPEEKGGGLF